MTRTRHFLITIILLLMMALPASADLIVRNGSDGTLVESGYYHNSGYVPETYVWFAIIIGTISLVVSTYVKTEINIFVLITPVFWAYAAWFAAFMEREIVSAVPDGAGNIQVVYTEVVFAQPILQYAMVFLFLLSVIFAVYVLFLKEPEVVMDKKRYIR